MLHFLLLSNSNEVQMNKRICFKLGHLPWLWIWMLSLACLCTHWKLEVQLSAPPLSQADSCECTQSCSKQFYRRHSGQRSPHVSRARMLGPAPSSYRDNSSSLRRLGCKRTGNLRKGLGHRLLWLSVAQLRLRKWNLSRGSRSLCFSCPKSKIGCRMLVYDRERRLGLI